jgi:peptide/nickel transport system substrate-binding protein
LENSRRRYQEEDIMTTSRVPRRTIFAGTLALVMGTTMLSFVPVSAQQMTDVGTPRDQTLVVDMLNARVGNPTNMNMYQQGVTINHGYHQLAGAQRLSVVRCFGSYLRLD